MLMYERLLESCKNAGQTKVLDHVAKAQPFVFKKFLQGKNEAHLDDNYKLDLPFKVCSFELMDDEQGQYCISFEDESTGESRKILSIIAEEIEPQKIIFYTLTDYGLITGVDWYHPDDEGRKMWLFLALQVQLFLKQLSKGQHGHHSPRTLFKWKDKGEKKQLRITKIIYVRDRVNTIKIPEITISDSIVQWSHAFWVMGHWRMIRGIGKDRDGNYNVMGKTWVSEFVKNAEAGDPIRKVRIDLEGVSTNDNASKC
jgi:hypothetical protein